MVEFGAFAFGVVLGWFAYFTNRFRKDVQFADLTTFVGLVGGGAVTALFGDGKTGLFAAYGIGLAVGFFAYFLTLLWMVANSGGAFTWTWFLDGRRKKPADDETVEGAAPTEHPMAMQPIVMPPMVMQPVPQQPPEPVAPAAAPEVAERSTTDSVKAARDQAVEDTFLALRELARRIANSTDDAERNKLLTAQVELTARQNELLALRLKETLDNEDVRRALEQLRETTETLNKAADEMKAATEAFQKVSEVIAGVAKVIGMLRMFV